jgi:hypothetical protein
LSDAIKRTVAAWLQWSRLQSEAVILGDSEELTIILDWLQWSRLQSEAVIPRCHRRVLMEEMLQWSRLQSEAVIVPGELAVSVPHTSRNASGCCLSIMRCSLYAHPPLQLVAIQRASGARGSAATAPLAPVLPSNHLGAPLHWYVWTPQRLDVAVVLARGRA